MVNQNGQRILQALQHFDEPATVATIVAHIADNAGVHRSEVKECVEETLRAGVQYGYIQRNNRKYFTAPEEQDAVQSEENSDEEPDEENEDTDDQEDRSRRRRRRGGRSRRRRSRRRSRR